MAAKFNNILKVGGVTLPDPSKMTIEDYDISESERNANGKMVSQMIREDVHKVSCEWAMLRPGEFIPDQYAVGELDMYAGDRKTPVYTYENGVPVYKGFTLNFIET